MHKLGELYAPQPRINTRKHNDTYPAAAFFSSSAPTATIQRFREPGQPLRLIRPQLQPNSNPGSFSPRKCLLRRHCFPYSDFCIKPTTKSATELPYQSLRYCPPRAVSHLCSQQKKATCKTTGFVASWPHMLTPFAVPMVLSFK